jgi:DNA-binding NtrC family response regulator
MHQATIFPAEDDTDVRALLGAALRGDGHEVREIVRGDELLRAILIANACGKMPDLVISDINLPGMSALDAVGLIRGRLPGLRVVLMTGQHDARVTAKAAELDAYTTSQTIRGRRASCRGETRPWGILRRRASALERSSCAVDR